MATATRNRIAPPLTAGPVAPSPGLPSTPADRQAALADAVFAAVLALQAQLAHPDAKVVREAAGLILDFEKTRLRHDRPVAGTHQPSPTLDPLGELDPLPEGGRLSPRVGGEHPLSERAGHPPAAPFSRGEKELVDDEPEDEAFADTVEQVRARLQAAQAEHGPCKILTPDHAERVARHFHRHRPPPVSCSAPPVALR